MNETKTMTLRIEIKKELLNFTLEVSLSCRPGSLTAIIGPSGAGKSTLMRIISGLDVPDAGLITLAGRTWNNSIQNICIPPQQRKLGLVFQEYSLFPHLSIKKNIAFAASDQNDVQDLITRFAINHIADSKPSTVSGGERQRAAICQALASRPTVLLLDEPFSALDIATRTALRDELKRLVQRMNIPVLHITHDLEEAFHLADNIFVMENGRASPHWLARQNYCCRVPRKKPQTINPNFSGAEITMEPNQCVPSFA